MSELGTVFRYQHSYSLDSNVNDSDSDVRSRKEMQDFVNSTLGLMTGGCEICVYQSRLYCEKLRKLVKPGDTRCESFARRPAAISREHI